MRIYIKLASAILIITCAAIGLVSFMNFVKYQNTYADLLASRFAVVAQSVRQTIENGLTLGFSLDQLTNVSIIIERYRREDPLIEAIATVDRQGQVVFSTEPAWENTRLPGVPEESAMTASLWHGTLGDALLLVGQPVLDNSGVPIGSVIIAYSRSLVSESLLDTRQRLIRISLAVLAVSILLSLGCVLFAFRGMLGSFRRIRDWLGRAMEPGTGDRHFEPAPQSDLERHFAQFWERARTTLDRLQDLEAGRKPDFSQEYRRVQAQLAAMGATSRPLPGGYRGTQQG